MAFAFFILAWMTHPNITPATAPTAADISVILANFFSSSISLAFPPLSPLCSEADLPGVGAPALGTANSVDELGQGHRRSGGDADHQQRVLVPGVLDLVDCRGL